MRIATRKTALALLIVTAFLALPANAANVSIGPGDIDDYFLRASDTVVLSNTWRVETTESISAWSWSVGCLNCTIVAYNMNYAFGVPPAPPSTPGNVLWQAPDYSIVQPTIPGYANAGSYAGSIGSAMPSGPIAASGLDVLVGWVTIHIVEPDGGGSIYPYFRPQEGIYGAGGELTTTLQGSTWIHTYPPAPEPGLGALLATGMVGLAIPRRG